MGNGPEKQPAGKQRLAAELKELKKKEAQYPILMVVLCEGSFHESYRFKTAKAEAIAAALDAPEVEVFDKN